MKHGFVCLCSDCTLSARVVKLAALAQWVTALTEAQREARAYSWHQPYKVVA